MNKHGDAADDQEVARRSALTVSQSKKTRLFALKNAKNGLKKALFQVNVQSQREPRPQNCLFLRRDSARTNLAPPKLCLCTGTIRVGIDPVKLHTAHERRSAIEVREPAAQRESTGLRMGVREPGLSPRVGSTRKSQTDSLMSEGEMISTNAYSPMVSVCVG